MEGIRMMGVRWIRNTNTKAPLGFRQISPFGMNIRRSIADTTSLLAEDPMVILRSPFGKAPL